MVVGSGGCHRPASNLLYHNGGVAMGVRRERDLEEALSILVAKLSSLCSIRGTNGRVTRNDWACLVQMMNNGSRALYGRRKLKTYTDEPLTLEHLQYWIERYREGSLYI